MTQASSQPVPVEWRLILDDGSNALKIVPVGKKELLIGRALTTDIPLDDARISRHHARLTHRGQQLLIEDLQTVNGTLVNGQPLTQPYALQPDDIIGVGPFTLKAKQSPAPPSRQQTRAYAPSSSSRSGWLLIAALIGLLLIAGLGWGLYPYFEGRPVGTTTSGPAISVAELAANQRTALINQPVTIEIAAADPTGIIRVELWAGERKVAEVDTQPVGVSPTLNTALQWLPPLPGRYPLEVRAYNAAGQVTIQPITTLTVVGEPNTATPTPALAVEAEETKALPTASPTIAPLLPTATASPTSTDTPTPVPSPTLRPVTATPDRAQVMIVAPALNVRTGPGTQYTPIGLLTQNSQAEIVGQASAGQGLWWEIRFAAGPGGVGWVSGDAAFVTASNTAAVPVVDVPAPVSPPLASLPPTGTLVPPPAATAAIPVPVGMVIRAPAGKTLLIVNNRSLSNQPALLTLSGGKSVAGGREVDAPAGGEIPVVLEPDFYRALWSSPARPGGFTRGADFTAIKDKIMVMWIVPEEGRTATEMYDEIIRGGPAPTATPTPTGAATPGPISGNYPAAPPGKAIFVAANRTLNNSFAMLNLSGGGFGGGKEIKLDAGVEIPLELLPGSYRAVWTSPARRGGFSAGREFQVSAGEVILSWIIPDQGQVFMQFPGQEAQQVNN